MSFKVYYFDGYGRAEQIRALLTFIKADFEDVRLTQEDWAKLKAEGKFEFGQLPALEWEGVIYTQSTSILRSIGHNNGLYSTDPVTMWKIDSTLDALNDLISAFYAAAFNPNEEAKKAGLEKFYTTTMPFFCEVMEKRLKANTSQNHMVGDKMTIADIAMFAVAYARFLNTHNPNAGTELAIVEKYPVFLAYCKHLGEEFKEYLATRKPSAW